MRQSVLFLVCGDSLFLLGVRAGLVELLEGFHGGGSLSCEIRGLHGLLRGGIDCLGGELSLVTRIGIACGFGGLCLCGELVGFRFELFGLLFAFIASSTLLFASISAIIFLIARVLMPCLTYSKYSSDGIPPMNVSVYLTLTPTLAMTMLMTSSATSVPRNTYGADTYRTAE